MVTLKDVEAGLVLKAAPNANALPKCTAFNAKSPRSCAWAELQFNDPSKSWVNASVSLTSDKLGLVLSAPVPPGAAGVVATSYGWGAIPMMSVYRADLDGLDGQLPVLPWRRPLESTEGVGDSVDLQVVV